MGWNRPGGHRQDGAAMTEFYVVALPLLFLGLGSVQAGLIYHGKTTLNYATFEAARTGATHHALPSAMREELGTRLAPLMGGDGSAERAAAAIVRSRLEVGLPTTRLEILNPTAAEFEDWGSTSSESDKRVIPNSHLRGRSADAGATPRLSLQDANLLKIKVTHGLELKVPIVGRFLTEALAEIDPANAIYYAANRLPLTSVATVRMQSEAWEEALAEPVAPPEPGGGGAAVPPEPDDVLPEGAVADAGEGGGAGSGEPDATDGAECPPHGIDLLAGVIQETSYADDQCGPGAIGDPPSGGSPSTDPDAPPPSSPVTPPAC